MEAENKKKKNHKYPKERKPRDTSYSITQQLIAEFGEEKLKEICLEYGFYTGADKLAELWGKGVPYTVTSYLRKKLGWQRIITSREESNAISVLKVKVPLEHFKTIKFSKEIEDEVLQKRS